MNPDKKREPPAIAPPDSDHLDDLLDEALAETFPASDPVAIDVESPPGGETNGKRKE